MNKDLKIYIILTVIVLVMIGAILIIKKYNSETLNEASAKCIAEKTIMYSQKRCSHCTEQKKLLGNYTSIFNIIECDNQPQKCADAGIEGTPT